MNTLQTVILSLASSLVGGACSFLGAWFSSRRSQNAMQSNLRQDNTYRTNMYRLEKFYQPVASLFEHYEVTLLCPYSALPAEEKQKLYNLLLNNVCLVGESLRKEIAKYDHICNYLDAMNDEDCTALDEAFEALKNVFTIEYKELRDSLFLPIHDFDTPVI